MTSWFTVTWFFFPYLRSSKMFTYMYVISGQINVFGKQTFAKLYYMALALACKQTKKYFNVKTGK